MLRRICDRGKIQKGTFVEEEVRVLSFALDIRASRSLLRHSLGDTKEELGIQLQNGGQRSRLQKYVPKY